MQYFKDFFQKTYEYLKYKHTPNIFCDTKCGLCNKNVTCRHVWCRGKVSDSGI